MANQPPDSSNAENILDVTMMPMDEESTTENSDHISPDLCKQGILRRFEQLANQLSSGWKYHVANTDGIKDAWLSFEDFYNNICQFTGG